jgi:hypothetical protein
MWLRPTSTAGTETPPEPRMTNSTADTHTDRGDSNVRARAKTPSHWTGLLAILRALCGGRGTGGRPIGIVTLVTAGALVVVIAFAASASAATVRPALGPLGSAAQPSFADPAGMVVDQSDGDLYVINLEGEHGSLSRYRPNGEPDDFIALGDNVIDGASGEDETPQGEIFSNEDFEGKWGATEVEMAVAPSGSAGGTEGDIYVTNALVGTVSVFESTGKYIGQISAGFPCGVAVAPNGDVYVGDYTAEQVHKLVPSAPGTFTNTANFSAGNVCQVAAGTGSSGGYLFAAPYLRPPVKIAAEGAEEGDSEYTVSTGENPVSFSIDPATGDLYVASAGQSESTSAEQPFVKEYDVSGSTEANEVPPPIAVSSAAQGVAVDQSSGDTYVSRAEHAQIEVFGPVTTVPVVTTEESSGLQVEAATLNGTIDPEGQQLQECVFEYGPATEAGFGAEVPCSPIPGDIPPDSSPHQVVGTLTGLRANTSYHFRLTVTVGGLKTSGEVLEFSTSGPPRITEILSRDAHQDSATLEATVDPRGFETSYRIESGPTDSYGNVAATGAIAPGEGPTVISADIGGLTPATTYHYRVVAESVEGGETTSPDQQVETLNTCGFTDRRCLELISRADKGPLAAPGKHVLVGAPIRFQAAATGSAFAYAVESGYPETTATSAGPLYLARRGSTAWSSEPLIPPTLDPNLGAGGAEATGAFKVLSSDLRCGILSSAEPLAPGAPRAFVEAGGANLYRRGDDGSYQLLTYLPPVGPPFRNAVGAQYQVVGMSPDCQKAIFRTKYRYPGIPAVDSASNQLYEWDHGTLRNVAIIPGPTGMTEPVPAESLPGALGVNPESGALGVESPPDYWRAVSADGSDSVFTAVSRFGGDAGKDAIFLRDTDEPAVLAGTAPATDISQSETEPSGGPPNNGNSRYWTASTDGKRIFFTARYGLAANGSSSGSTICANTPFGGGNPGLGQGCDLYEYDAAAPAGARLTDLSPDTADPRGAGVVGVLDASEDGSNVYFAARGSLGGAGRTEAENLGAGTYNIYLADAGSLRFVGSLGEAEAVGDGARALISTWSGNDNQRWSSRSTPDGDAFVFESSLGVRGDVPMVHLYSAADGTSACVSCRRDGRPPFSGPLESLLIDAVETNGENRIIQPTVLTGNGRLYFYSYDPLAPGAVEGDRNLYQWEHGQVSLIATEPLGVPRSHGTPVASFFGGAGADGDDVYFATPQSLTAGAPAGWNVYDARVDGGLPEPAPSASPCDPTTEGACNPSVTDSPTVAAATTSTFTGPGNPPPKHHKKKHHKKKHHKKAGKAGRANGNRGAGK